MFAPPKVYPITDFRLSGIAHIAQVERLIAGGATLVQLREKSAGARDFYEQAVECVSLARRNDVRIIINDRVDIALAAKADGVHLGQDDIPPEEARILLGETAIIGFSTHSIKQAVAAASLPIDYIAIGPIFSTSTKVNADPAIGLDGLRAVKTAAGDLPLVAIGGINQTNIRHVFDAGADSVAIIGSVVSGPDRISAKLSRLISLVESC